MSVRNHKAQWGWMWTGYVKKPQCEVCGATGRLCVHHKDRDPSNNADHGNLQTLCRVCHRKEHAEEIADAQRRPDVNERRGASIRIARTGKSYPKTAAVVREAWKGEHGERMRTIHNSDETRRRHSEVARRLMNDPEHLAKRKAMKEVRDAAKST